jgi:hypothetical protein
MARSFQVRHRSTKSHLPFSWASSVHHTPPCLVEILFNIMDVCLCGSFPWLSSHCTHLCTLAFCMFCPSEILDEIKLPSSFRGVGLFVSSLWSRCYSLTLHHPNLCSQQVFKSSFSFSLSGSGRSVTAPRLRTDNLMSWGKNLEGNETDWDDTTLCMRPVAAASATSSHGPMTCRTLTFP